MAKDDNKKKLDISTWKEARKESNTKGYQNMILTIKNENILWGVRKIQGE